MLSPRVIIIGLLSVGLLVLGIVVGLSVAGAGRGGGGGAGVVVMQQTPTVLERVQALSEYVTVKYVMEKVVVVEDVKWYGDNRVLLVAHGVVKAGLDLGELGEEAVEVEGKRVRLKLPKARVTEVYLDEGETRVVERTTGMLRMFDKDLEQRARVLAVEEMERAARYAGIMEEAGETARSQLRGMLGWMGYEVEFAE